MPTLDASEEPRGILFTMIIEWWERVRGIDRWPEGRAVIESVRSYSLPTTGVIGARCQIPPPVYRKQKMLERMSIAYTSVDGIHRTKRIWLLTCPILLTLDPGGHFYVRYCPNDPNRLYIRERIQGYIAMIMVFGAFGLNYGCSRR
jgi:hypothetical protein